MNKHDSSNDKRTIVEEGTSFKGTLSSSCPIDVRGSIEGDVETPSLFVSASGAVHGRAKVGSVQSEGVISGEFDADSIQLAGSVKDNTVIRARSLEVRLSSERGKLQVIFGECELSVGDEPTERALVSEQAQVALEVAPAAPEAIPEPAPAPLPAEQPELRMVGPLEAAIRDHFNAREPGDIANEPKAEASTDLEASAAVALTVEAKTDDEKLLGNEPENADASGKRRASRRSSNGANEEKKSWSQPPSQPPPAS